MDFATFLAAVSGLEIYDVFPPGPKLVEPPPGRRRGGKKKGSQGSYLRSLKAARPRTR